MSESETQNRQRYRKGDNQRNPSQGMAGVASLRKRPETGAGEDASADRQALPHEWVVAGRPDYTSVDTSSENIKRNQTLPEIDNNVDTLSEINNERIVKREDIHPDAMNIVKASDMSMLDEFDAVQKGALPDHPNPARLQQRKVVPPHPNIVAPIPVKQNTPNMGRVIQGYKNQTNYVVDEIPQPPPRTNEAKGRAHEFLKSVQFEVSKRNVRATANAPVTDKDEARRLAENPSRTQETIEAYRARANSLIIRYRRERSISSDLDAFDPHDFITWLLGLRPTIKKSTWRLYKQAGIVAIEISGHDHAEDAINTFKLYALSEVEMGSGTGKDESEAKKLTSALKAKKFPFEDYERIDAKLRLSHRSEVVDILRDWLKATFATGLRPVEWRNTQYVEMGKELGLRKDHIFLVIGTAKVTNGRGNGPVRTLNITDCTSSTLLSIRKMSENGKIWDEEGSFDNIHSRSQRLLQDISSKIFTRKKVNYALYSARHQFIANMKSVGLTNAEISALVGHIVDETAASTYGKKSSAWSPDKIVDRIRGIESEINTVRRILQTHEERLALKNLAEKGIKSNS